jgi:hypothetical protein
VPDEFDDHPTLEEAMRNLQNALGKRPDDYDRPPTKEEALETNNRIKGDNVVPIPIRAAPPTEPPSPGYEGNVRPDIENFLDRGVGKADIPNSDEPLSFYNDVIVMDKHFNKIFAKVLKGVRTSVIWERYDDTYVILPLDDFHSYFQYSSVMIVKKEDLFGRNKEWVPSTKEWLEYFNE